MCRLLFGLALRESWLKRVEDQDHGDDGKAYSVADSRVQDGESSGSANSTTNSSDQTSRPTERMESTSELQHAPLGVPSLRGTGGPQPTPKQLEIIRRESEVVRQEVSGASEGTFNDDGTSSAAGAHGEMPSRALTPRYRKTTVEETGLLTPGQNQ
jgi:hypothetical protein